MKGISKVLSLVLVMGLLCSCLTGWSFDKITELFGGKVTAERLLEAPFGKEKVESIEANMKMVIDMSADMSELMGEGTKMNTSINFDANIKSNDKISAVEGKVNLNLFGMDINQEIKSYSEKDGSKITNYTYNADDDLWTYTISENKETTGIEEIKFTEILKSYELQEIKKEDTEYVIKGVLDIEKSQDLLNFDNNMSGLDSLSMDTDELTSNLGNSNIDIVLTFDKESKLLKTMSFDIDMSNSEDMEDIEMNEFSIVIEIKGINNCNPTIPSDVKDTAVEYADFSNHWEGDVDFDLDNVQVGDSENVDNDNSHMEWGNENSEDSNEGGLMPPFEGETDNMNSSEVIGVSDLDEYFTLNNEKYSLYETVKTVVGTNHLEFSDGEGINDIYVNKGDMESLFTSDYSMTLNVANPSTSSGAKVAADCVVSGYSLGFTNLKNGSTFNFNGITESATYDDVVKVLGESEDVYYGTGDYVSISYELGSNEIDVEFVFIGGSLYRFNIIDYSV